MDVDMFHAIIDEGSTKGLYSIKLNFRGEPLIHPRIADLVTYAKERGILDVFLNTNATLLTEEVGKQLINSGLDRLIVSFEGFTPEIYEQNRVGARFSEVVENVRKFIRLKRRLGVKMRVRLQTVAISDTPDYLERYREFWGEWADEITCIDLRNEQKDYSAVSSTGWECPYPWRRLCITWDGVILTCPFVNRALDSYSWKGFGRVGETTIEEAWCSKAMEQLRLAHRTCTSHEVEPCCYCSYRGTELAKIDREDEP
jgi:MoaA/NifB/PqqE/SkfB family radical SAM enzyme